MSAERKPQAGVVRVARCPSSRERSEQRQAEWKRADVRRCIEPQSAQQRSLRDASAMYIDKRGGETRTHPRSQRCRSPFRRCAALLTNERVSGLSPQITPFRIEKGGPRAGKLANNQTRASDHTLPPATVYGPPSVRLARRWRSRGWLTRSMRFLPGPTSPSHAAAPPKRPAACSKRSAPSSRSIGSAPASSNVPPEDEVAKFREKYGGDPDVVEQRDLALRCRQPKGQAYGDPSRAPAGTYAARCSSSV